jgi:hypothetical protein
VGARHVIMIVLIQAKDFFEFLATIIAEVIVHGHGEPPGFKRGVVEIDKQIVVFSRVGSRKFGSCYC